MLIDINALVRELPPLKNTSITKLCEDLAMLGFPVDDVKNFNDGVVIDVDVTSNRGDVQSHRGIARDLAAKLDLELSPLPKINIIEDKPALSVWLEASDVVPIYSAALLDIDANGNCGYTPNAVKTFLTSINVGTKGLLAVDASNEILHLYGQPTHAFDADLVNGDIAVRWARDGESIVTIDMVERRLSGKDLVIADSVGPIGIAGLIGGYNTKVSATTKRLLLESAFFDPRTIQAMSYRHNLHTDASQRFGRGVDPKLPVIARNILIRRLQDWAGARLQSAWTVGCAPHTNDLIYLPWSLLDRVFGSIVDRCEAVSLLQRLGCNVVSENSEKLVVKTPSWRYDLRIAVDLVEEILRLKGYESISSEIPQLCSVPVPLSSNYTKRRNLASRLANLGFFQTVTMGFVGAKKASIIKEGLYNDSEPIRLQNPLGENYAVMRGSLLPDLTRVAKLNLERGLREAKFFEIAPVFKSNVDKSVAEIWTLGIFWGGESGGNDPLSSIHDISKAEGQSLLIGILKSIGVTDSSIQNFDNWQVFDSNSSLKSRIGWQFEIPISLIPNKNWEVLPRFTPFSRLPIMERDLSLIVNLDQSYSLLRDAIITAMNNIGAPLHDLKCVDVFRHKSLPRGRQAWLLRLEFQASTHSLTREEVDGWMDLVLTTAKSFGAELRG